jgi:chromate transporter
VHETADRPSAADGQGSLGELARLALKLGFTAFGGPAAHIAMLRDEVVTRRSWFSEQQFLDMLGVVNLIPGPNSTEMVIQVGHARAGWRGMIVAGVLFILPAALIVLALAWTYVRYGSTPAAMSLLYGIKPVIIAVLAQALWGLLRTAIKTPFLAVAGLGALALFLAGVNAVVVLFGAGLFVTLVVNARRLWDVWRQRGAQAPGFLPLMGLSASRLAQAGGQLAPDGRTPVSLLTLFLTFLKIGAVLYGSGYVLLAFLRNDFVVQLGWLTDRQLLDAVAVGQFTPGPVFTTATFVGYVVGSWPGAALATIGIFLPSFVFLAIISPLVPRLRRSPWMSGLLDGVNVAAVGLMAAVTWELARAALVDWLTALLAILAAILLIRCKINSAWLVLGGGAVGVIYRLLIG